MSAGESSRRNNRGYAVLAIGIPFASTVCIVGASIIYGDQSPRLEVVEHEISVVSENAIAADGTFVLKNRGREPLLIRDVITTQACCGRTVDKPNSIPPNGEAAVRVQVDPSRVERREHIFTLRTNDPRHEEVVLKVNVIPSQKPPFFYHEPASIKVLNVWRSGPCHELVLLTIEKRDQDPWIESVTCDSNVIAIERVAVPETRQEYEHAIVRLYRYSVVLKELPAVGTVQCSLLIKTRDFEKIARLSLDVVSAVKIAPSVLFGTDRTAVHKVELVARETGAEVIANIEARPEWLDIQEDDTQSPGTKRFLVRLRQDPGAVSLDGLVRFETESPAAGKLELRVCLRQEGEAPN